MSLSENRHHEKRVKSKFKKIISKWFSKMPTEKQIGKAASVHGSDCSCSMCGNPRKYFDEKTLQEKKSEIKDEIFNDDVYVEDLNPKLEHEKCGCEYCMKEWEDWNKFKKDIDE